MKKIVSRHPAVAEFVRAEMPEFETAEVVTSTSAPHGVSQAAMAS